MNPAFLAQKVMAVCDDRQIRPDCLEYMAAQENIALQPETAARADRFITAVEAGHHLDRITTDRLAIILLLSNLDIYRANRLIEAVNRHIPDYAAGLLDTREAKLPLGNRFRYRVRYLLKIGRLCRMCRNRLRIRNLVQKYHRRLSS